MVRKAFVNAVKSRVFGLYPLKKDLKQKSNKLA
jgi:hypothetical protein